MKSIEYRVSSTLHDPWYNKAETIKKELIEGTSLSSKDKKVVEQLWELSQVFTNDYNLPILRVKNVLEEIKTKGKLDGVDLSGAIMYCGGVRHEISGISTDYANIILMIAQNNRIIKGGANISLSDIKLFADTFEIPYSVGDLASTTRVIGDLANVNYNNRTYVAGIATDSNEVLEGYLKNIKLDSLGGQPQ